MSTKKKFSLHCILIVSACCFEVGCGTRESSDGKVKQADSGGVQSNGSESYPVAINPQFGNWSRFQVGTKVVRRKEVTNPNGTVVETETLVLTDKSDTKVAVESQMLVERHDGTRIDNPSQTFEFAATFRVPPSVSLEQFQWPSLKAIRTGTEKVVLSEKEYEADVFEWTESNEAGPMSVKLLSCDDFPGRKIRQEMFTQKTDTRSIENIVAVDLVNSVAK